MSRLRSFFAGTVRFTVRELPAGAVNKLRGFGVRDLQVAGTSVAFTVLLSRAVVVRKLLANFDFTEQENTNLWRGINYLLNHLVLSMSIILAIAAFLVADMGIYRVQINGVDAEQQAVVRTHLATLGVDRFLWKNQVSGLDLATNLVSTFPEIAHAYVHVAGNTLVVDLSPAAYRRPDVKADVVAHYDAVVRRVIAYSGVPLVAPGDVVRRGDALVTDAYADTVVVIGEVAFRRDDGIVRLEILIS